MEDIPGTIIMWSLFFIKETTSLYIRVVSWLFFIYNKQHIVLMVIYSKLTYLGTTKTAVM